MTPVERVGWITIVGLAAAALIGWLFSACAFAAERPTTLVERLVHEQTSLQSRTDPPVDALAFAQAVAAVPKVNGTWAALMLAVAAHESALSARIARGECKSFECDHGLAWGLWQRHRNAHNHDQWGSTDVNVQALDAARALRSAFYTCSPAGKPLRADWALATFRVYAGHGCGDPFKGEEKRVATFKRLQGRL